MSRRNESCHTCGKVTRRKRTCFRYETPLEFIEAETLLSWCYIASYNLELMLEVWRLDTQRKYRDGTARVIFDIILRANAPGVAT